MSSSHFLSCALCFHHLHLHYCAFHPSSLLRFSSIFTATLLIHLHRYTFRPSSLEIFKMQISSFLIAGIALGATCVSGRCFQSGQNWGDHGVAKAELAQACKELQGRYASNEVRTRCRNSGPVSFVFEIQNEQRAVTTISEEECNRNIGAQIDNCGHGGQISHSGVRFRYVLYKSS